MKLCTNCIHYSGGHFCNRNVKIIGSEINPVTGARRIQIDRPSTIVALDDRRSTGENACGPEGKFFESVYDRRPDNSPEPWTLTWKATLIYIAAAIGAGLGTIGYLKWIGVPF